MKQKLWKKLWKNKYMENIGKIYKGKIRAKYVKEKNGKICKGK